MKTAKSKGTSRLEFHFTYDYFCTYDIALFTICRYVPANWALGSFLSTNMKSESVACALSLFFSLPLSFVLPRRRRVRPTKRGI